MTRLVIQFMLQKGWINDHYYYYYNTQSASSIHITYKRTYYGTFSLTYRGATVWNSLTTDLKELKSYNKFKTSLKIYIQNDLHLVG